VERGRLHAAAWSVAVDALTAEVVEALSTAGVASILLKGPTIAAWLYDDPGARPYSDSDLLVDPARLPVAQGTLERLGFRRDFGPLAHPGMEQPPSQPWRRGPFTVDLHQTLPGADAAPARVWALLRSGCEHQEVGGRRVSILSEPGRLVHVALHAAHHGPRVEAPLRDLRRAIERAPDGRWDAAAALARQLEATDRFAAGLHLAPGGDRVLERFSLEAPAGLRDGDPDPVPLVDGLRRLGAAPGWRATLAMVRDEALPSREFMRWWTPYARRARGLPVAYAWRWLYLLWHVPRALRAVRARPRRRGGSRSP
jgi:hypothetical protein